MWQSIFNIVREEILRPPTMEEIKKIAWDNADIIADAAPKIAKEAGKKAKEFFKG